jgi:hypothetical protein
VIDTEGDGGLETAAIGSRLSAADDALDHHRDLT